MTKQRLQALEKQIETAYDTIHGHLQTINDEKLWDFEGSPYSNFLHYCQVVWSIADPYRKIRALQMAQELNIPVTEAVESHLVTLHAANLGEEGSKEVWAKVQEQERPTVNIVRTFINQYLGPETEQTTSPTPEDSINSMMMQYKLAGPELRRLLLLFRLNFEQEYQDMLRSGYLQLSEEQMIPLSNLESRHLTNYMARLRAYNVREMLEEIDSTPKAVILPLNQTKDEYEVAFQLHVRAGQKISEGQLKKIQLFLNKEL